MPQTVASATRGRVKVEMVPDFEFWQQVVAVTVTALGALTSLFATVGTSARRLRRDLSADKELVESAPLRARVDLRADIAKRTYLLVSASRYPSITLFDVVLVAILGVLSVLLVITPYDLRQLDRLGEVPAEYFGVIQAALIGGAIATCLAIARSWCPRAKARLVYVYERLGDDEASTLAKKLSVPVIAGPFVATSGLFVLTVYNVLAIVEVLETAAAVTSLIFIIVALGFGIVLIGVLRPDAGLIGPQPVGVVDVDGPAGRLRVVDGVPSRRGEQALADCPHG